MIDKFSVITALVIFAFVATLMISIMFALERELEREGAARAEAQAEAREAQIQLQNRYRGIFTEFVRDEFGGTIPVQALDIRNETVTHVSGGLLSVRSRSEVITITELSAEFYSELQNWMTENHPDASFATMFRLLQNGAIDIMRFI